MTTYSPGMVVTYKSERPNNWCREGMALADKQGRLADTYWNVGSENHILTDTEANTAVFVFDINECDELDRREQWRWEQYHPDERFVLTAQHGLVRRFFVRKGAQPHHDTMVANAEQKVREAEAAVAKAERELLWRRDELARLVNGGAA